MILLEFKTNRFHFHILLRHHQMNDNAEVSNISCCCASYGNEPT